MGGDKGARNHNKMDPELVALQPGDRSSTNRGC